MIQKKVIARYELKIFEDGQIELFPLKLSDATERELNVSQRTKQILAVLEKVKNTCHSYPTFSEAVTDAINTISAEQNISQSSVRDKITRQQGLSMAEFLNLTQKWIRNGDTALKEKLQSNTSQHHADDQEALDNFFG